MNRLMAAGIAFLSFHTAQAFADTARGNEAFSREYFHTAEREWREAAQAGDPAAMVGLGALYDTGHGVSQDFAAALSWYRRAAEAGDAAAMFNVGAMYDNGRGTSANRAEAVKWYAMAAKKGNGRAAYAAATIYRDGDGVPQDNAIAIKFFRIAAAAGIGAARLNLANLGESAPPKDVAASSRQPATAAGPSKASAPMLSAAVAAPTRPELARAPVVTEPFTPRVVVQPSALGAPSPALKPASMPSAANGPAPATRASAVVMEPLTPPPTPPKMPETAVEAATEDSPGPAADPAAATPSRLPAVQLARPDATAASIEQFHRTALQRTDVSAATSKRYEDIVHEIARRAAGDDPVARYDAGFAYEHGIGISSDLVRSYVYYILATLSPDADIKSAALKGAFEVGGRLTDAQHASAADMLTRGIP